MQSRNVQCMETIDSRIHTHWQKQSHDNCQNENSGHRFWDAVQYCLYAARALSLGTRRWTRCRLMMFITFLSSSLQALPYWYYVYPQLPNMAQYWERIWKRYDKGDRNINICSRFGLAVKKTKYFRVTWQYCFTAFRATTTHWLKVSKYVHPFCKWQPACHQ